LSQEHPDESIVHETIYQYIHKTQKRKEQFVKCLTRPHKNRRKYTGRTVQKPPRIPEAIPICKRPVRINTRQIVGHWETDLMEGNRLSKQSLSVTIERKSRYVKISKIEDKTAFTKSQSIHYSLNQFPKKIIKSITIDNGSENTGCIDWKLPVYRCNPYHSWEKGSVENIIGRIRRYIPKGTDLKNYTDHDIQALEDLINNTPRKCLNYLTPKESLLQFLNYNPTYKPKWCTSK